jgi:hypothetical protein
MQSHIGAVLQQITVAGWKPLSFFSRNFSPTEWRYSTFDNNNDNSQKCNTDHHSSLCLASSSILWRGHRPNSLPLCSSWPPDSYDNQPERRYKSQKSPRLSRRQVTCTSMSDEGPLGPHWPLFTANLSPRGGERRTKFSTFKPV